MVSAFRMAPASSGRGLRVIDNFYSEKMEVLARRH